MRLCSRKEEPTLSLPCCQLFFTRFLSETVCGKNSYGKFFGRNGIKCCFVPCTALGENLC